MPGAAEGGDVGGGTCSGLTFDLSPAPSFPLRAPSWLSSPGVYLSSLR